MIEHARLHDLTVMTVSPEPWLQYVAQDLIFRAGRPILLLPEWLAGPIAFETVVVAWDGSRAAAQAVADALPFLQQMRSVQLVSITGDKPFDPRSLEGLRRNLEAHGVVAKCREEPADHSQGAGAVLTRFCSRSMPTCRS